MPDQIAALRQVMAEAEAENLDDRVVCLDATIYLLRWLEANAETVRLAHQVASNKAVKAVTDTFHGAEITRITKS